MEDKPDNEKTLDYLKQWSENFKSAQKIAPLVDKAIEQKEWEVSAFKAMPDAATEIPHDHLRALWLAENTSWAQLLPPMPFYNQTNMVTGLVVTTHASTASYEFVTRASEIAAAKRWSNEHSRNYVKIQSSQNRIEAVREFLQRLNPERVKEFEDAENAYRAWRLGSGEKTSAGFAMRTVLEHVKGDLFDLAINKPVEQKVTWEQMAERLVIGGPSYTPYEVLLDLGKDWKSIHIRLTDVGKNLHAGLATDLNAVFVQLVDHLYGILSLIDPKYLGGSGEITVTVYRDS